MHKLLEVTLDKCPKCKNLKNTRTRPQEMQVCRKRAWKQATAETWHMRREPIKQEITKLKTNRLITSVPAVRPGKMFHLLFRNVLESWAGGENTACIQAAMQNTSRVRVSSQKWQLVHLVEARLCCYLERERNGRPFFFPMETDSRDSRCDEYHAKK